MAENYIFSKLLNYLHQGKKGFTLIELLVVIAILGVLAGVAILNIGGFIDEGQEEAKQDEGHQVGVSAVCYLTEGNSISKPFIVGPEDQGVLDSYLIGNLMYSWTVDVDGSVILYEGGGDSIPEFEPKPKPKIDPRSTIVQSYSGSEFEFE
jgi:type IV pilus assembly protein PilA